MKRYSVKQGDLLTLQEDPKGDLVSLKDLKEHWEDIGEASSDIGDTVNSVLHALGELD